tara:strand:+ start:497 stop:1624 length:1128 start_codon:yes stop_codon:yes gene_type:complete
MSKDEVIERITTGKINRRQFNKFLIALGGIITIIPLSACDRIRSSKNHPLVFTWEGWEVSNLHGDYIKKHGQSPNFAIFADEEEAFAKIRAGFQVDITQPCSYKIPMWHQAGLLEPIDTNRLSNWGNIASTLKTIPGTVINGQRYFIPTDWGQTSVLYRADLAPEYIENETWDILWDSKYKGRLSMSNSLVDGVMVAAIRAGAKDPFNMTPQEIIQTRAALKEQLPLIRFYWDSPTEVEQGLASGELIAGTTWNDSFASMKSEGHDVKFMNPKEGAMTWVCGFSIMTGHEPDKIEKIYDYIDAYMSVEAGVFDITEYGYGHANTKAFQQVDPEILENLGFASSNPDDMLNSGIFQIAMANESELQKMFDEVKAGL